MRVASSLGLLPLVLATPAWAGMLEPVIAQRGSLDPKDAQLQDGSYAEIYQLELNAGDRVLIDLTSKKIDPYVVLQAPSGRVYENDDLAGSKKASQLDVIVEESGTWQVYATSYVPGARGAYDLRVAVDRSGGSSSHEDPNAVAQQTEDGVLRWSGSLGPGDTTLTSGEFLDPQRIQGHRGDRWIIDLRSSEFDPFLMVKAPSGHQEENDDFEGARDRSVLDIVLDEDGEYMIGVTTYEPGQHGSWDLTLRTADVEADTAHRFEGSLGVGDETLSSGEWYDYYDFEGTTGQQLHIVMQGDFDTYVGINGPGDFNVENDDAREGGGSAIDAVLPDTGTYRVVATSYQPNMGGHYTIDISESQETPTAAAQRDSETLTTGVSVRGRLEGGDMTLTSGEFEDIYTIEARRGQLVAAQLRSSEFDPYIGLITPGGDAVENDDWQGQRDLARIELFAPEDGRYRVVATSYAAGAVGAYEVLATVGGSATIVDARPEVTSSAHTYGVFAGIADYPGDNMDLAYTDEDPVAMYEGMQHVGMSSADGRLLVDGAATVGAFTAAIREYGARMTSADRLVVFYSGHGGREPVEGFEPADPDGMDETLVLYDGEVRDDELAALFDEITVGTVILVLDSCFSGGFSKDVISRPGRMGLFSSQEDVTSAVAVKFKAGGYLARFMVEALGDRQADEDRDEAVTALELSSYLYERYRSDVKSDKATDDIVITGQNLGYQQIVVDRGGIGPSQVLFRW